MAIEFEPRPYQQQIIAHGLNVDRQNTWAGMGTGKTVCVLSMIKHMRDVLGETDPVLVLAPKRVAQSTWPDEARKWKHLAGLRVQSAVGNTTHRHAAILSRPHVTTINYDVLPWLVEHYGHRWPWRTIIADESTRLKSFRLQQGGQRAQALGQVAHKFVDRWVNLTGTPSPNGLRDLWGQAWFLDKGQRLGRTFTAFENRWFELESIREVKKAAETRITVPRGNAQAEIEARLRDITITVRAKDHMGLPDLIENTIEVDLPPLARKHYRELEREMYTMLASGESVDAATAAVKSMKCLQAANGALYVDDTGRWEAIHDAKLEAMQSIVEEAAGAPILVAYQFKSDLARLQQAFPQGRMLDSNPATITAWNAGKIPMLFAHPKSAGHGLNLQDGGNILVFFGLWWGLEEHEQIIERIGPTRQAQSGYDRPVFVHRIVARNTVDELVLQRLQTKASVQALLLDAMRTAA